MSKTYVTTQHDTWDIIAKKQLGSEYLMHQLIEANPDHRETVIFSAGVVLTIPDPVEPVTQTLPPWKESV